MASARVECSRCGAVFVMAPDGEGPITWLLGHWERRHGGVPAVEVRS